MQDGTNNRNGRGNCSNHGSMVGTARDPIVRFRYTVGPQPPAHQWLIDRFSIPAPATLFIPSAQVQDSTTGDSSMLP